MAEVPGRYLFNETNFDLIAAEVHEGRFIRFIEILKGMAESQGWYRAYPSLALKLVVLLKQGEDIIERDLIRRISRLFVRSRILKKEEFPTEFFGLFDPFLKKEAFLSGKSYEIFIQFLCTESLDGGAFEKDILLDLVEFSTHLEDDYFETALFKGFCLHLKVDPSKIHMTNFFRKKYWHPIINSFLQNLGENSFMNVEGTILTIPFSALPLIQQFRCLIPMLAKLPNSLWIKEKEDSENMSSVFLLAPELRASFIAVEIEGVDASKIQVLQYFSNIKHLIFSGIRPSPKLLESALSLCLKAEAVSFSVHTPIRYSQTYRVNTALSEKLSKLKTNFPYLLE